MFQIIKRVTKITTNLEVKKTIPLRSFVFLFIEIIEILVKKKKKKENCEFKKENAKSALISSQGRSTGHTLIFKGGLQRAR